MKSKVYAAVALLAIVSGLWALSVSLGDIQENGWDTEFVRVIFYPFIFALAAMLQLYRPTPRLMMVLSGIAALYFVSHVTAGKLYPLCLVAAGLLSGVYGLVVETRSAKTLPKHPVKGWLLIIAGVMACIFAGMEAWDMVSGMIAHIAFQLFLLSDLINFIRFITMVGLAVFCFKRDWRASEYYRLFFIAHQLMFLLFTPFALANLLMNNANALMILDYCVWTIAPAVMVVFVLIPPQACGDSALPPPPPPEEEAGI